MQPIPSYVPGGLNAIQEDSEMEEKETVSKHDSEESANKVQGVLSQPLTEPKALSSDDIDILSECIIAYNIISG